MRQGLSHGVNTESTVQNDVDIAIMRARGSGLHVYLCLHTCVLSLGGQWLCSGSRGDRNVEMELSLSAYFLSLVL